MAGDGGGLDAIAFTGATDREAEVKVLGEREREHDVDEGHDFPLGTTRLPCLTIDGQNTPDPRKTPVQSATRGYAQVVMIAARPTAVWRAFTDEAWVKRWYAADAK